MPFKAGCTSPDSSRYAKLYSSSHDARRGHSATEDPRFGAPSSSSFFSISDGTTLDARCSSGKRMRLRMARTRWPTSVSTMSAIQSGFAARASVMN